MNRTRPAPDRQFSRTVLLLTLSFGLAASPARADRDDERIVNLRNDISALEGVVNQTKSESEKARLDTKLQRLREELAILAERQAIDSQQKALEENLAVSPLDLLREKLRGIDRTVEEGEGRLLELATRRKRAVEERDGLVAELDKLKREARPEPKRQAELEESVYTKNEVLRSLALEREGLESEVELAREAERMRSTLKGIETAPAPTLRSLFDAYTRLRDGRKVGSGLGALASNLDHSLKVSQGTLDLAQRKLAKFDEELALLEKQTGFFSSNPQVERLLVSQRSQKKALSERIPLLAAQVDSVGRARQALRLRQELVALEAGYLHDRLAGQKDAYLRKLRWPVVALASLLATYLLLVLAVLPLLTKDENLFVARRLTRYLHVLAVAGVVAGFLFEDLSMVAATLGVVSAALVIALQDVCTSAFGWFVIVAGRKLKIGDRIEIDGAKGDVIDIELFRTTLLEVNAWLDCDQTTGRVITIPNNVIFKMKVFNYSHGHPFIWNKTDLTITYSTPVATATALFNRVLEEETRPHFAAAQKAASIMRRRYGVADAVYEPRISTKIADSGVTFSLYYVTHYRDQTTVRNQINRRLIAELETHPAVQLAYNTLQLLHNNPTHESPAAVLGTPETRPPFPGRPKAQA